MAMISAVTATARDLVAELLMGQEMYAVLHVGEPVPSDPVATAIGTSGDIAVRLVLERNGSVLANATPVQFVGVDDVSTAHWVSITADPYGEQILFYGMLEEPEIGPTSGFGMYEVPAGALKIIIG